MADKKDKIVIKKEWGDLAERFLVALQEDTNQGNYSVTAKVAGVSRQYIYALFDKFPEFDALCRSIRISKKVYLGQVAENRLAKLVNQDNVAAIIFSLKKYNPEEFGDKGVDKPADPVQHELSAEFRKYLADERSNTKKIKSS